MLTIVYYYLFEKSLLIQCREFSSLHCHQRVADNNYYATNIYLIAQNHLKIGGLTVLSVFCSSVNLSELIQRRLYFAKMLFTDMGINKSINTNLDKVSSLRQR